MEAVLLAVLFSATSALFGWLAVSGLRLSPRSLAQPGRVALEFVGLWMVCVLTNVAVGGLTILAVRTLTRMFISVYLVNDISIVIVSAIQAVFLRAWISSGRRQADRDEP